MFHGHVNDYLEIVSWVAIAFLSGTFCEYWMHRSFHLSPQHPIKQKFPNLGKVHVEHHAKGTGQGVLLEFWAYVSGSNLALFLPFLYSWQAGLGWLTGGLVYCAFAAFAHQLQHDTPLDCVWMQMPVHYVHHKYNQWHHNFGIGVDWWDRIFGTYQSVDWVGESELRQVQSGHFNLKWW